MGQKLMHEGKPWTGEGFPPDHPDADAGRGVDADSPVCVCATLDNEDGTTGWQKDGHASSNPSRARRTRCARAPMSGRGKGTRRPARPAS